MKILVMFILFGAASLILGACQNRPHNPSDNFGQKTHREFNPQTGSFEQSPPFGKQSNKSGNE